MAVGRFFILIRNRSTKARNACPDPSTTSSHIAAQRPGPQDTEVKFQTALRLGWTDVPLGFDAISVPDEEYNPATHSGCRLSGLYRPAGIVAFLTHN